MRNGGEEEEGPASLWDEAESEDGEDVESQGSEELVYVIKLREQVVQL